MLLSDVDVVFLGIFLIIWLFAVAIILAYIFARFKKQSDFYAQMQEAKIGVTILQTPTESLQIPLFKDNQTAMAFPHRLGLSPSKQSLFYFDGRKFVEFPNGKSSLLTVALPNGETAYAYVSIDHIS